MVLKVAEHLFHPHSAAISGQGSTFVGEIGGEEPGLFLTHLPMNEEMNWKAMFVGQPASSQPLALASLTSKEAERKWRRTLR